MRAWIALGLALVAQGLLITASCGGDEQSAMDAATTPLGSNVDAGARLDAGPFRGDANDQSIPPSACSMDPVSLSDIPTFVAANTALGPGSCSPQDISAFTLSLQPKTSTPKDWYDAISPTCQQCVFSGGDEATWQIIVLTPTLAQSLAEGANAEGFLNVGPCFQEAPSGSAACAKSAFDLTLCIEANCPNGCPSNCGTVSIKDDCSSEYDDVTTSCGASLAGLSAYCGVDLESNGDFDALPSLVNVVCGAGGDAGAPSADASTD